MKFKVALVTYNIIIFGALLGLLVIMNPLFKETPTGYQKKIESLKSITSVDDLRNESIKLVKTIEERDGLFYDGIRAAKKVLKVMIVLFFVNMILIILIKTEKRVKVKK